MNVEFSWGEHVGQESRKTWKEKLENGFFDKYMSGIGLDIGGTGYVSDVKPILPSAIIVDLDYPGYDGYRLPFADQSQDYVYSSHCLEHIYNDERTIKEWFRVLKVGGHMIIVVPHQWLYEKKQYKPSRFNEDHKRFYTAGSLVYSVEMALEINTFRIRHLRENDKGHDYNQPDEEHSKGEYEIEIVLEKLK